MAALVVFAYIFIGFIELFPLYRKDNRKDFWVATGFTVSSFIIALCLSLGVNIPSPATPIRNLVISVFGK